MQAFEYKLVSAPRRGAKVKGARTPEARFAAAVEAEVNRMAADGWEYLRSDTLPCEERQGWFSGRATVSRTLLVFRRATASAAALSTPSLAATPMPSAPLGLPTAAPAAAHPAEPPFSVAPAVGAPSVGVPSVGDPAMPDLASGPERPFNDPVPPVRIRPDLPSASALPPVNLGGTSPASFAAPRRVGAPVIGQAPLPPSPSAAATRSALEDLLARREPGRLGPSPRPPAGPEGGDPA